MELPKIPDDFSFESEPYDPISQQRLDEFATDKFYNDVYNKINVKLLDSFNHKDHYISLKRVHREMGDINYAKKSKEENDRIYTWLLVGKRLGICKDVRTLIGEQMWSQLFDDDSD